MFIPKTNTYNVKITNCYLPEQIEICNNFITQKVVFKPYVFITFHEFYVLYLQFVNETNSYLSQKKSSGLLLLFL